MYLSLKKTLPQVAKDVCTFLTWAASPEHDMRKKMAIKVILFLQYLRNAPWHNILVKLTFIVLTDTNFSGGLFILI